MAKYLTTTTIIGLTGKGSRIQPGVLVELSPENPQHLRLIQGGDVTLYTPPPPPPEVAMPGKFEPHKATNEALAAKAKELAIELSGTETRAELIELVKAKLAPST